MSLQTKFFILLAALAAAVLLALGTAGWALNITYREVREPVRTSSRVIDLLIQIEKDIDELRGQADPKSQAFRTAGADRERGEGLEKAVYLRHMVAAQAALRKLQGEQAWSDYAGRSALKNLQNKFAALKKLAAVHFQDSSLEPDAADGDPREIEHALSAGRDLHDLINNQLFDIHELLKRVERRVVDDIVDKANSSGDLRYRLGLVLGLSVLITVLMAALALSLMRRWVVQPVGNLRTAAARISAGDFEHRVPIAANAPRDEITALSTEVNYMTAMVKQMQTERVEQERLAAIGELVRRLAHNLRIPLSGIRGLAELTRSDVAHLGDAAADVRETQTRIITAVDRFETWLSDLLRVTKPALVEPTPTDVSRWLTGLVEAHRPLAQSRGVDLKLLLDQGPSVATFDARHLEHAVSAILSNALEAAAQSRQPEVPAMVRIVSKSITQQKDGQTWEIRIEDTGAGVPAEMRESIFKPYFTTKKDGNGIGLAVARQVARAHGGDVIVEDSQIGLGTNAGQPSGGAAFVLWLPLASSNGAGKDKPLASIGQ